MMAEGLPRNKSLLSAAVQDLGPVEIPPAAPERAPRRPAHPLVVKARRAAAEARRYPDLTLAVWLAVVLALSAVLPVPRLPDTLLGLVFMLYVPGYLLLAALLPQRDDLLPVQRQALIVVVNLGATPLLAYLLLSSAPGLTLASWKVSVAVLTLALVGLAGWRRRAVPPADRYSLALAGHIWSPGRVWAGVQQLGPLDWGMVVAAAVLALTVSYAALSAPFAVATTEFYVGQMIPLRAGVIPRPPDIPPGVAVELWVANREGSEMIYTVTQQVEDADPQVIAEFTLKDGRTQRVASRFHEAGGADDKVTFRLYRQDPAAQPCWQWLNSLLGWCSASPYRYLELWL